MTTVVDKGYVWIAGKDGTAHGRLWRAHAVRTLCGIPAIDPRYAWPAAVRCEECTDIADGVVGPAPREVPLIS